MWPGMRLDDIRARRPNVQASRNLDDVRFLAPGRPFLVGSETFSRSSAGARNDVHANEFANATCGSSAGVGRRLHDPTSPRTIDVTRPASTFCQPTNVTFAVLSIASVASTIPTSPRVSPCRGRHRFSRLLSATGADNCSNRRAGLRINRVVQGNPDNRRCHGLQSPLNVRCGASQSALWKARLDDHIPRRAATASAA